VYRMVIGRLGAAIEERSAQAVQASLAVLTPPPDSPVSSDRESVALIKALGLMIAREQPEDLPRQIVMAVTTSLKADLTAMLGLDDVEYADVISAYDHVQQKPIAAMALKMDEQPTLQDAIKTKEQRHLDADKNLNELVDLYTRLDIQKIGPAV